MTLPHHEILTRLYSMRVTVDKMSPTTLEIGKMLDDLIEDIEDNPHKR